MMKERIDKLQRLLVERGLTLTTAESCTGGNIAHQITSISGSSNYFVGTIVAYSNSVKKNVLRVNLTDIDEHGAVSEEVAIQMALGVKELLHSDYSVSTTGIAGPTGGSVKKPVGTVWIGVSSKSNTFAKRFNFEGTRSEVIKKSTEKALQLLENVVLKGD